MSTRPPSDPDLDQQVETLQAMIQQSDLGELGSPVPEYVRANYSDTEVMQAERERDDDLDPALAFLIEQEGFETATNIIEELLD